MEKSSRSSSRRDAVNLAQDLQSWDSLASEAGEIALHWIRDDPTLFHLPNNNPDDPPRLNAMEIDKIDDDSGETIERTGLAFYDELSKPPEAS